MLSVDHLSQLSISVAGIGLKGQVLISSFPMCELVIRKRKKQVSGVSLHEFQPLPDARSESFRIGQIYTNPLKDEVPAQLLLHDSLSRNPFSPSFLLQSSQFSSYNIHTWCWNSSTVYTDLSEIVLKWKNLPWVGLNL
ncbi:Hypothetical predicted protein [Prunus dulcis]|uniref:Uncharacterized protein n=1 Tax=Prunus dulcis TaxID=3755 RepID=A0A5E4GBC1_PRUDU|nr:Hypothetical predicted protein [Prunus dulcis]